MAAAPCRLFLIDGSALAYRSHFALKDNPLMNSRGENTSATYLFARTLRSLFERESPSHIAVVFDTPEPTFRHRAYAPYKATREVMPEALVRQLPRIRELVAALGVAVVEKPGFEADDVIATLARQAAAAGMDACLVAGDKDFMQLLGPRIRMYDLKRGAGNPEILGPEAAVARFGVPPDQVVDVLGLMGDTADNVPGVPGIGPKTAKRIIAEHGSLEAALEAARQGGIGGRTGQRLVEHAEQARLCRRLVTLDAAVDLDVAPDDLTRRAADPAALRALYGQLEFQDLLREVASSEVPGTEREYHVIRTPAALDELIGRLRAARRFVLDLETTGLNPRRAAIVGISVAIRPHEAFYVPTNLEPPMFGETAASAAPVAAGCLFPEARGPDDTAAVLAAFRPLLADPAVGKCGQNIKYDLLVLRRHGVDVAGVVFDTMVAAYLEDPGARQHGLDALALRLLGLKKIPTESLIGRGKQQITMAEVPVERVAEYACEDADVTCRLWNRFERRLEELDLVALNREVEVPLIGVLADLEDRGIRVDVGRLAAFGTELGRDLARLEAELHELAGERFNVLSPRQLQPILYEKLRVHEQLGVKRIKRTKTGLSTDQEVLEALRAHPFVAKLLEYRTRSKLLNTYVEALPALVDPGDGRIHTSFNQTVAATGRLSSSNPNLQNIPIRTEIGRRIREAFLPAAAGWKLISADYSQVELRVLAHLSQDAALLEGFRAGEDIHRRTAALVFKVAPEDVTPALRSQAKAINFGILYGMGSQRLARETGIREPEARAFIDAYFERLPAVKAFLDGCVAQAEKDGFVTTLLRRRRNLPEIRSTDPRIKAQARNIAVNTPIQGTAADLIKVAMVNLHRRLQAAGLEAGILLQVHDELVLEAPDAEVEEVIALARREMEGAFRLEVPLRVDVGVGSNWLEAHA
ncbi:MAG: DNA polymerase I [Planctomycetes bacterium]|nr:DNA polymerase I [Planctomycetota bacterium]